MFRVDAFQKSGSSGSGSHSNSGSFKIKTLYCNWTTSSSNPDAENSSRRRIMFSVGRSSGDITFENDRCVSRRHCRVWIEYLEHEERYRLFVEDQGSKFGSFIRPYGDISIQEQGESSYSCTNTEVLQKFNTSQYSAISDNHLTKKLPSNVPFELDMDSCSVLLRCGVTGSRVVITPVPLVICISTSTINRKEDSRHIRILENLLKDGHKIGAQVMTTWDSGLCTHLVVKGNIAATTKVLSAWSLRKPIVTVDWVEQMLTRTDAADIIPNELEYEPSYASDFMLSNDSMERNILKDVLIILLEDGDFHQLCIAGGAKKIIKAFGLSDKEFFSGSWLDNVIEEVKFDDKCLFGFLEPRKRTLTTINKRVEYLRRRDITMTNSKQLAKSITYQSTLLSSDGSDFRSLKMGNQVDRHFEAGAVSIIGEELGRKRKSTDDSRGNCRNEIVPNNPTTPNIAHNRGETLTEEEVNIQTEDGTNTQNDLSKGVEIRSTVSEKEHKIDLNRNDTILPSVWKKAKVDVEGWCTAVSRTSFPSSEKQKCDTLTEFRSDLMIKSRISSASVPSFSKRLNKQLHQTTNRCDFKRFRKNLIMKSCVIDVEMQSVLPRRTKVQYPMDQKQREIDQENEAAEALFSDNSGSFLRKLPYSRSNEARGSLNTTRRSRR